MKRRYVLVYKKWSNRLNSVYIERSIRKVLFFLDLEQLICVFSGVCGDIKDPGSVIQDPILYEYCNSFQDKWNKQMHVDEIPRAMQSPVQQKVDLKQNRSLQDYFILLLSTSKKFFSVQQKCPTAI